MSRNYGHIQSYEREIKKMLEQGMTHREIGEAFGLSKEQVKGFVKRLHAKERRAAVGEALKRQGRPAKSDKSTQTDKS